MAAIKAAFILKLMWTKLQHHTKRIKVCDGGKNVFVCFKVFDCSAKKENLLLPLFLVLISAFPPKPPYTKHSPQSITMSAALKQ